MGENSYLGKEMARGCERIRIRPYFTYDGQKLAMEINITLFVVNIPKLAFSFDYLR